MEDADRVVWNWLLGLFCGFVDQLPDLDEIRHFLCLGDSRLAFGIQRAGFVRSPRWIDFGLFKFQPSEIAKWATLVMGASILARSKVGDLRDSLRGIVRLALCFSLPMFLIFLQPDLGSTLVFPPIAFSLLYATRIPTRFFIATFALFVVIIGVLGWDVFRYYQYKSENPRPSEATIAYQETLSYHSRTINANAS